MLWSTEEDENKRLHDADILVLCGALTHNNHLISLNLNKNNIGILGIRALAQTQLQYLFLSKTGLTSDCIFALQSNNTIHTLDVSGNTLSDTSVALLAKNTNYITLNISENRFGPKSMKAFSQNTTC